MGRNQTRRLLALWPKSEEPAHRREQATPVRDGVDVAATETLAARVTRLVVDAVGYIPSALASAGVDVRRQRVGRASGDREREAVRLAHRHAVAADIALHAVHGDLVGPGAERRGGRPGQHARRRLGHAAGDGAPSRVTVTALLKSAPVGLTSVWKVTVTAAGAAPVLPSAGLVDTTTGSRQ